MNDKEILRTEYPRPQFARNKWMTLNGEWQFAFDDNQLGIKDKWFETEKNLNMKINVPFCYQSKLSGIHQKAFHETLWYKRKFNLNKDYEERQVVIHFGAVDYSAEVWINGFKCGMHDGGHSPFSINMTPYIDFNSENDITVKVVDFNEDHTLPRGKQNWVGKPEGVFYTNTSGIWQSVWIEYVNKNNIANARIIPNTLTNEVTFKYFLNKVNKQSSVQLYTTISYDNEIITKDMTETYQEEIVRTIEIPDFNDHGYGRWWSPDKPHIYSVKMELFVDEKKVDEVDSYFGMRSVSIEKGFFCVNHLPFYTKSVLYQGYFEDGLMTAKSDEQFKADVMMIKEMGFNSVRIHQKYEDPRFLYWCDVLGLLVWGEAPNAYSFSEKYVGRMTNEWIEILERDMNHPSIGVWVPLNESWGVPKIKNIAEQINHSLSMYHLTKSLDTTRPVISNDGWEHTISDICTVHDYEDNLETLSWRYENLEEILKGPQKRAIYVEGYDYNGEPMMLSEFGGVAYEPDPTKNGWGYSGVTTKEEFEEKVLSIIHTIQKAPLIQGYCYTQFNDVEQEVNGLLTIDRVPKISIKKIRSINNKK
ncbi:glycoside hydrolase family 2 protein [Amphibacillus sp. Q70]|uniref:glycoside hydrolase family 2 protein n=1 Tax=Amphibacillus sp. Q70 TaxID=3453416 RepID=UPI003F8440CB